MADLKTIISENYNELDPRIQSFGDEIYNMALDDNLTPDKAALKYIKLHLTPFGKFDKMCFAAMGEKHFPIKNRLTAGGQLIIKYGAYAAAINGVVELAQQLSNYIK